jgi:hypothetical protein
MKTHESKTPSHPEKIRRRIKRKEKEKKRRYPRKKEGGIKNEEKKTCPSLPFLAPTPFPMLPRYEYA